MDANGDIVIAIVIWGELRLPKRVWSGLTWAKKHWDFN